MEENNDDTFLIVTQAEVKKVPLLLIEHVIL